VLTAGGPVARRGGGGSFGGSHGSFQSGSQRITSSGTGRIRPKVIPSPHEDTVYDKTRVDTKKGNPSVAPGSSVTVHGVTSKKPGSKPLPVAKPLDGLPGDKKSTSGANPIVTGSSVLSKSGQQPVVAKSGPQPVVKAPAKATSGPMPTVKAEPSARASGPQPVVVSTPSSGAPKLPSAIPGGTTSGGFPARRQQQIPNWMIAAGVAGAAIVLAALVIAMVMFM
jgi:hypothetical protein